ncbi:hypothetical protein Aeh1ORF052c [Aeromonas phage Aeh1]|uniref:Uncharacterized protein n=1 Tax=Aeromonas phage Aeh1 TaxID=2880362 RepID=Q76Z35_9CAUD|nr:hypothetical protein Aeh1p056 [Aeromonas phage Aeh1]AAQ17711.1 hypothetical protein Aeh1ORF052c [Aeromonas phage Aeh1]
MFRYSEDKKKVEIDNVVRVKGLQGVLTEVTSNSIKLTIGDIAYSELVFENGRWHNAKDPIGRPMYLINMSDYTIENGELFYTNRSVINVGDFVDEMKVVAETGITLLWDRTSSKVESVRIGIAEEDPCLILIDNKGMAHYAIAVDDGDYEAVQLYTTSFGQFEQLYDLPWRYD